MSKKNTQDFELKTENYRNTKMPKYKIQKSQSKNAASGGEVSNISQEHNLSVALYKKRSYRTGNMFFFYKILIFEIVRQHSICL